MTAHPMIQPQGSYYHVRLTDPPRETPGGILLPDSVVEPVYDGLILAAGPGETLPNGALYPMQASPGDRCVFQRPDYADLGDGTGFVADSRLVALIPGPEHDCVLAANDWVFLEPERQERVHETESGVLVANYAAPGQDARAARRGDELFAELGKIGETERFTSQPTEYERHRVTWDFLHGLTTWERAALGEAIKRNGQPSHWRHMTRWCTVPPARAGQLVDVGPGLVDKSGLRVSRDYTLSEYLAGRIHLDRQYHGVSVFDGRQQLLAVRADCLAAVEA